MSTVKRGDKHPITLTVNADLTGCTVRLIASQSGVAQDLPCTVTDPAGGVITHTLTGLLEVGVYKLEVETTRGGEVVTFPSDGYARLTVTNDLD